MEVEIELIGKSDVIADIRRCLYVLYGSRTGTLALDRDFGIDWGFLDQPQSVAKALIEAEIIRKTRKYEQRAKVKNVSWNGDFATGNMIPKVVLEVV